MKTQGGLKGFSKLVGGFELGMNPVWNLSPPYNCITRPVCAVQENK